MRRFALLPLASLRFRLLLLVLLAAVPALGLTFYTHAELRRLTAAGEQQRALQLARTVAGHQEDTIEDAGQLLFALAQLPEAHSADPNACSGLLARLLDQHPRYASLGVAARDGRLVCSAPPAEGPANLADREYLQQVLQTRAFAVGGYHMDPLGDRATLDLGYPVLDEAGEVEAVVFASLDLAWLGQLAAEAELPEGSTLIVVDRAGTILVRCPDPEAWTGRSVPEAPIVKTILAQQGEGAAESVGLDGIPRLFALTPLSEVPEEGSVYVGIGIPTSVAFADANRVLVYSLAGLGAVTALALAAAWFGSDWLVMRWANILVRAAKQLSASGVSAPAGLPDGKGEPGHIAHALEALAGSLEQHAVERDRAEEALRESQQALSRLMSNLPGMAYRCRNDGDWTMEFVSEGCFKLTGYHPSELLESRTVSYGQLIHPQDRESVQGAIQTALQERNPFQITYRIVTATGEEKWVWGHGQGVFSPEGDLLALEGYAVDTTEQVLAQQRLEQRVANRTRELAALYDVAAVTSASLDLVTVLESALDPVLAVVGSGVGSIHLLEENKRVLRLAAWRGIPHDMVAGISTVPVDSGLTGWVVERGEPVVVTDVATGLRPLLAIPTGSPQAYVGVPIRAKGQVLGVLSVVGEAGRRFSAAEVSLLSSIADQVGVAVENARLYQQAEQLAVVRERERLARELHDSVSQSLYSLTLLAEAGRQRTDTGDWERVAEYLERLGQISQQALKEMRLLVYELRPLALKREGLIGALQQRLDAVEKRAGVDARLLVEGGVELPAPVEEGLYRIAQEALNNTLKHARASCVTVRVCERGDGVTLEIVDDGAGFDPDAMTDRGGMGLVSMRERAEKLGGTLTIVSAPGKGTKVSVEVSHG